MLIGALQCGMLSAQIDVWTSQRDNSRDNWNQNESILTVQSVSSSRFKKLCTFTVDDGAEIYAQTLIIHNVTMSSGKIKDLLLIATMGNDLYAFDRNQCGGSTYLWKINFGATRTSYPGCCGGNLLLNHQLGILSTPVIDTATKKLYIVHATPTPSYVLSRVDLASGTVDSSPAPVTISGQYPGTGYSTDTVVGGNVQFNAAYQAQRSALALANGKVYIQFGSFADTDPWHGWWMAYDAATLTQSWIYCTSPNDGKAGLWGANGAPTIDASGSLIMMTGNGTFSTATSAYGESIIKVNGTTGALMDYFTPANWSTLNTNDSDLSSGRPMLIPGTTYVVGGAKDYRVFKIDLTNMCQLEGTACSTYQLFYTNAGGTITDHSGIYTGVLIHDKACFPNTGGKIYCFTYTGTAPPVFNTTPITSVNTYEFPGAVMSATSNGDQDGIIWATTVATSALYATQPGTLRAFDSRDLSEIWNSDQHVGDTLGTLVKFNAPVSDGGEIFQATLDGTVQVYGIGPHSQGGGSMSGGGNVTLQ